MLLKWSCGEKKNCRSWHITKKRKQKMTHRTTKVLRHRVPAGALGSKAAAKSQTFIFLRWKNTKLYIRSWSTFICTNTTFATYPSYAPLTILLLSNRIQRTSSSWPSKTRRHAPHSMSHNLMKQNSKCYLLWRIMRFNTNPLNQLSANQFDHKTTAVKYYQNGNMSQGPLK